MSKNQTYTLLKKKPKKEYKYKIRHYTFFVRTHKKERRI
jgi:hypothetical protein